jgi:hypothetical protein
MSECQRGDRGTPMRTTFHSSYLPVDTAQSSYQLRPRGTEYTLGQLPY